MGMKRGGTQAKNYVLHIPATVESGKTLCGRSTAHVNYDAAFKAVAEFHCIRCAAKVTK